MILFGEYVNGVFTVKGVCPEIANGQYKITLEKVISAPVTNSQYAFYSHVILPRIATRLKELHGQAYAKQKVHELVADGLDVPQLYKSCRYIEKTAMTDLIGAAILFASSIDLIIEGQTSKEGEAIKFMFT